jgi:hypothetical protein
MWAMDTLTLDGKNYLSSKRAAEITGYAKDYIGQLCREGRVEARLVGRNWYILESSLHTHRFGAAVAEIKSHTEEAKPKAMSPVTEEVFETKDETPILQENLKPETMETESLDPETDVVLETKSIETETVSDTRDIENIQEAWKAWFSERSVDKKERVTDVVPSTVASEESKEELVTAQESVPETSEVHMKRISTLVHTVIPSRKEETKSEKRTSGVHIRTSQGGDMLIVKAAAIALAGLSMSIAIIGTGALDDFKVKNSFQAAILSGIAGISLVNK